MRARGGDSGSPEAAVAPCLFSCAWSSCALQKLPRGGYTYGGENIHTDLELLRKELLAFYTSRLWPNTSEAEDFVQRTFERLLSRDGVQDERALLFHIADAMLKNEYRDRERQPETVSWEQLVGDGDQLDHLPQFQTPSFEDTYFAADFDAAIRDLDPDPRDAFILGELRGLTSRESAELLDCSHVTANVRRSNATATIKKELTHA